MIGDLTAEPREREGVAVIDPAVAGVEQLEMQPLVGQPSGAQLVTEGLRTQTEVPLIAGAGVQLPAGGASPAANTASAVSGKG